MRAPSPRRACTTAHRTAAARGGACALACALLSATLAAAEPPPPVHPVLKACDGEVTPACGTLLESRALREHPGLARRDGATLWLTPPTGEPQRFDDGPEGTPRQFYLGPATGTDSPVVLTWARGQAPRYGLAGGGAAPLMLDAPPWPAPGGRMLVTAALASADQPGSVSLFLRVGAQWRRLVRFEPASGLGFVVRGWRGDGAVVRLDWVWRAGTCGEHGVATGTTQLRDGPFGWDLFPPPPTSCP